MTCGDGSFGALGHGDWNSSARPKLIEQLLRYHISAVRNHVSQNVFYRLLTNITDPAMIPPKQRDVKILYVPWDS